MLVNSKQYILEDTVEAPAHVTRFSMKWVSSQTKKNGCSPLLSLHEATSGMMCPALCLPVQERYGQTGVSPLESNYDSRSWSTWHMRRGWRSQVRARVKPDPSCRVQWKDKSQQSQVLPREILAGHRKFDLWWEWCSTGTRSRKGCGITILGELQNSLGHSPERPELT